MAIHKSEKITGLKNLSVSKSVLSALASCLQCGSYACPRYAHIPQLTFYAFSISIEIEAVRNPRKSNFGTNQADESDILVPSL